jgi:hypothetical protein
MSSRNQVMADDRTLLYIEDLEQTVVVSGGVTTISVTVGGNTYIQTLTVSGGTTTITKYVKQ